MHRCAVVPYEGTEPYIFVSYAHKDADQVYPIMEALYDRGYRIWYDDGIAPGSEWPENIAQHLSDSAIILACVSENSIASDNCRREITFAFSKRKAFLGIILEPTQMSLGMEMQLSAQQCIMKYGYSDQESFLRKVCSCPELAACLAPVPEAAAAEEETQTAATEIPLEREKAPKPPKVKKEKTPKAPRDPAKKAKRGKVLAIVAAAMVVLIAAIGGIYIGTHVSIDDESVSKSETYLSIYQETITRDTIRNINKLKKLEHLAFDDCTFESGTLELLEPAETLEYVYITECTGVSDLSWLAELEALYTLNLRGSGIDHTQLPALPARLHFVSFHDNPDISDLSALGSCPELLELNISGTAVSHLGDIPMENLRTINFSNTLVENLSPLANAQALENVDGSNSAVISIAPLAALQQLKELRFNDCAVSDSQEVFGSLRLQSLELANTQLQSLAPFVNCTVLETVNLEGTAISDISVLEKSAATLQQLNLSYMPLTGDALQFLKDNSGLTHVYLDGISMEDLGILSSTTGLQELSAVGCGLKDIRGILQNRELKWVRLADNEITDVSPLQCISQNWVTLDLGYNPITDVSALSHVQYDNVILVGTQVDPATASALEGSCLVLSYDPALAEVGTAPEGFYDIYLLDCPADKMVAVEDAIGTYRLTFLLSWQELLAKLAERGLDYSFLERN